MSRQAHPQPTSRQGTSRPHTSRVVVRVSLRAASQPARRASRAFPECGAAANLDPSAGQGACRLPPPCRPAVLLQQARRQLNKAVFSLHRHENVEQPSISSTARHGMSRLAANASAKRSSVVALAPRSPQCQFAHRGDGPVPDACARGHPRGRDRKCVGTGPRELTAMHGRPT